MGLLPMDASILPPSDDRVFKLILTGPDSKPMLMDLISALIGRNVVNVEIRNNEIPPESSDEKAERLDVNCRIDDGSQVDLEMQASSIEEESGEIAKTDAGHQNLKGKSIYYLCDLHASQPSKGLRRYDKLARTYQVTFCTYNVFPQRKSFVNSFSLRHDQDNVLLSDALHVIFVELCKLEEILKKSVQDMTDLEKWSVFFRYADQPEHRQTVNDVIASKEALKMAGEVLINISQDERERAVFRSRRMYQTDMQSNLATAWDNGKMEGKKEGKKEGIKLGERRKAIQFAHRLLEAQTSPDQVSVFTDLSMEEVLALQAGKELPLESEEEV